MKKTSGVLLCAALTVTLMTTACTPKTSAERHARQYVHAADEGFNPNFYVNKADSTRLMVPFFRHFHEMGIKDRAEGVSREDAQQRLSQFHSEEFLKSIQSKETFAGRTYNDSSIPSPKGLKAIGDAISATYMDGYDGIE